MHSRVSTRFGLGVVLCGLLSACGGSNVHELAPTEPGPGTPAPAPAGFLHVRNWPEIVTYRIDALTGHLEESFRQAVEQYVDATVEAMTGEPRGRFVYLAYNPLTYRPPFGEPRPSVVAFASSPTNGALTAVSEEWSSAPRLCSMAATHWDRLTAGVDRVYALWENTCLTSSPIDDIYVTFSVSEEGRLGQAQEQGFREGGREGLFDAHSRLLYSTRTAYGTTALIAHAIEPDGSLSQMGGSNLCLAATIGWTQPLAAVRGFVFAAANVGGSTICLWEGARLAPRADLAFTADRAEAWAPDDRSQAALVVFAVRIPERSGQPVRHELRLFALRPDGDFRPLDTVESVGPTTQMLFHPSGRFLYANAGSTLQVFSIGADGRLVLLERLDSSAGMMAVTIPREVRGLTPSGS